MIKKVPLDSLMEIDPRVTMRQVGDILLDYMSSILKASHISNLLFYIIKTEYIQLIFTLSIFKIKTYVKVNFYN